MPTTVPAALQAAVSDGVPIPGDSPRAGLRRPVGPQEGVIDVWRNLTLTCPSSCAAVPRPPGEATKLAPLDPR